MAIVVLLDQRDSKTNPDLVSHWEASLNSSLGSKLALPFTRTIGDEMQAVIRDPAALGRIAREIVASGSWWMGIGIGDAEQPLPSDPRMARGSAFWAAREAIGQAKTKRKSRPIAVVQQGASGPGSESLGIQLDECLGALSFIVSRRTGKQKKVADAYYASGGKFNAVVEEFALTPQGARQRLNAAGAEEERDLILLTARLARPGVDR
ncbi:MAG TPA: hypothetical protein VMF31_09025 [Solirubrobacterales bacterium]|nr:hypothetical protein [Solirubrobacterales bacterium]